MKHYNQLIKKFLNQHKFGQKIYKEYYIENRKGFLYDQKIFRETKSMANTLIKELKHITFEELSEACAHAFSGRLEFNGKNLKYTAGQFYDLEVPNAVLSVLEHVGLRRALKIKE